MAMKMYTATFRQQLYNTSSFNLLYLLIEKGCAGFLYRMTEFRVVSVTNGHMGLRQMLFP